MFLNFESNNARKISLEGRGGNQDPGDPGVGKVRGGGGFFFLQEGGGLTLDDAMVIRKTSMSLFAPVLLLSNYVLDML